MAELCQRFGISRKTGYKMLARHAELGLAGLKDGSQAPKVHPNQTPPEVEAAVLRLRSRVVPRRVSGNGEAGPPGGPEIAMVVCGR